MPIEERTLARELAGGSGAADVLGPRRLAFRTSRPELIRKSADAVLFVLTLAAVLWDLGCIVHLAVKMHDSDFGKAYYSARGWLEGRGLYDWNESIPGIFPDGITRNLWNLNPPHFQLVYLPFALLPPMAALFAWCAVNGVCVWICFAIIRREVEIPWRSRPVQWLLLGLLMSVGMTSALFTGHCSFLLLLLVTLCWREARHGRWARAGTWLGLGVAMKPFLAFVIPYLLLRRRWRALAATAGSIVGAFAAGLLVFGVAAHRDWLAHLGESSAWAWQAGNTSLYGLMTRTFGSNPVFDPLCEWTPELMRIIWLAVSLLMGVAALALSVRGSSARDVDLAFALLLVTSILLSPLGWTYYLLAPLAPVVAVIAARWHNGDSSGLERSRPLLVLAGVGLLFPIRATLAFQPHPWATVLLGNLHVFSLLALWLGLAWASIPWPSLRSRSQCHPSPLYSGERGAAISV